MGRARRRSEFYGTLRQLRFESYSGDATLPVSTRSYGAPMKLTRKVSPSPTNTVMMGARIRSFKRLPPCYQPFACWATPNCSQHAGRPAWERSGHHYDGGHHAKLSDYNEGGAAAKLLRIVTIDIASGRTTHQFGYLLTAGSYVAPTNTSSCSDELTGMAVPMPTTPR